MEEIEGIEFMKEEIANSKLNLEVKSALKDYILYMVNKRHKYIAMPKDYSDLAITDKFKSNLIYVKGLITRLDSPIFNFNPADNRYTPTQLDKMHDRERILSIYRAKWYNLDYIPHPRMLSSAEMKEYMEEHKADILEGALSEYYNRLKYSDSFDYRRENIFRDIYIDKKNLAKVTERVQDLWIYLITNKLNYARIKSKYHKDEFHISNSLDKADLDLDDRISKAALKSGENFKEAKTFSKNLKYEFQLSEKELDELDFIDREQIENNWRDLEKIFFKDLYSPYTPEIEESEE